MDADLPGSGVNIQHRSGGVEDLEGTLDPEACSELVLRLQCHKGIALKMMKKGLRTSPFPWLDSDG